jgi:DNA-binding response OmpR family regulator
MPKVDGYHVLNYLKSSEELSDIRVIILSAKNKISDVEIGMQLGANKYISKPFSTKKLVKDVKELLKK